LAWECEKDGSWEKMEASQSGRAAEEAREQGKEQKREME
jgi:hypothetical protein